MRVICWPYHHNNPYQRRLAAELERLGVVVEPLSPSDVLRFPLRRIGRADVLHVHWLHPFLIATRRWKALAKSFGFLATVAFARLRGVRIVWTAHNLLDHEQRFLRTQLCCTRLFVRMTDRVLVHSGAAGELVADMLGVARTKLRVVPHAHYIGVYPDEVDRAAAREKLGIAADRFVFLSLGQIRDYKGTREAIDAFRQLDCVESLLLVAGRPMNEQVDERVREWIDGNPRVDYRPGFVADDELQYYFRAADVVVLPFRDVLTSGSLLLAMSFAKPVILPDLPVLRETAPADGALFYPPNDDAGLLHAMRDAVQRRAEVAAMGKSCYDKAMRWGWADMARATMDAYQEVARQPAKVSQ